MNSNQDNLEEIIYDILMHLSEKSALDNNYAYIMNLLMKAESTYTRDALIIIYDAVYFKFQDHPFTVILEQYLFEKIQDLPQDYFIHQKQKKLIIEEFRSIVSDAICSENSNDSEKIHTIKRKTKEKYGEFGLEFLDIACKDISSKKKAAINLTECIAIIMTQQTRNRKNIFELHSF